MIWLILSSLHIIIIIIVITRPDPPLYTASIETASQAWRREYKQAESTLPFLSVSVKQCRVVYYQPYSE